MTAKPLLHPPYRTKRQPRTCADRQPDLPWRGCRLQVVLDGGQVDVGEGQGVEHVAVEAAVLARHGGEEGVPARGLEAAQVAEARGVVGLDAGAVAREGEELLARRLGADAREEEVERDRVGLGAGQAEQEPGDDAGAVAAGCCSQSLDQGQKRGWLLPVLETHRCSGTERARRAGRARAPGRP